MRQRQYRGISYDGQSIFGTSIIQRKDWVGDIWVSRVFLLNGDACNHTPETSAFVEVKPNTVGEWTGLKDKDDQEIYEGDIVKGHRAIKDRNGVVIREDRFIGAVEYDAWWGGYRRNGVKQYQGLSAELMYGKELEVIGNIYANPELLTK